MWKILKKLVVLVGDRMGGSYVRSVLLVNMVSFANAGAVSRKSIMAYLPLGSRTSAKPPPPEHEHCK